MALARAIIAASQTPVLLLDDGARVIAASDSFLSAFELPATNVEGLSLFSLGAGEWDTPRLRSFLAAALRGAASGDPGIDAYEVDIVDQGGRRRNLVLSARRLDFEVADKLRLLLTVVDGTEARAAERLTNSLIHDKEILLQEVQHRVANSLQIIASVLLQNARRVTSAESRMHLRDAHQRVMSVAALQKQLAVSNIGDVTLKPYLTQLCQSISASMIEDHNLVSIEVNGDGSATSGEASVSIGLIVTEPVINALKFAFPESRKGTVTVDYHSLGGGWALSVCDDGVGMPTTGAGAKAGLGSAIVQALASQLHATITVADLHPGTGVSVVHRNPGSLLDDAQLPDVDAV